MSSIASLLTHWNPCDRGLSLSPRTPVIRPPSTVATSPHTGSQIRQNVIFSVAAMLLSPRFTTLPLERDRQLLRPSDLSHGPFDVTIEPERWHPLQELLQRHPQFHAGDVDPEATMDACPEGDVPVGAAVEPDLVAGLELVAVPAGRRPVHEEHLPRLDGLPTDFGVHPADATRRHRGEGPHEFLPGGLE